MDNWVIDDSDVHVSDTVVSRGANCEILRASWKNIDVACKRRYSDETATESSSKDLENEFSILSKLRHPNVLLFIGVTLATSTEKVSMIITELLTTSLYDVIETSNVELQLPDIIDIMRDVACGIEHLHSFSPPLIHGAISAKNILIDGDKMKITGFGSSSLGTSIAYTSSEGLSGLFTTLTDIFSFGILLVQLCLGEYPKIERREAQIEQACKKYPILAELITTTTSSDPAGRPTAGMICQIMGALRNHDKYYPPLRRLSPEKDIGVIARNLMLGRIEEATRATIFELEQCNHRLNAEEQRWREEAARADAVSKKLDQVNAILSEKDGQIASYSQAVNEKTSDCASKELLLKELTDKLDSAFAECRTSQQVVREKELEIQTLRERTENAIAQSIEYATKMEAAQRALDESQERENDAVDMHNDSQMLVQIHEEQCAELEARLDQALSGWTHEKDLNKALIEKNKVFITTNATLQDQLTASKEDCAKLTARLKEYADLPTAENIRTKFKEMESCIEQATQSIEQLEIAKREACDHILQSEKMIVDLEDTIHTANATIRSKSLEYHELENVVASLNEAKVVNEAEILRLRQQVADLELKLSAQVQVSKDLDTKLDTVTANLALETMRVAMLMQKNGPLPATASGSGGADAGVGADAGTGANLADSTATEVATRITTAVGGNSNQAGDAGGDGANDMMDSEERAAKLLQKLDATAKIQVQHAVDRGITSLISLIKNDENDESVSWRVARAVREAVLKDEPAKTQCIADKVDDAVLRTLRKFDQSSVVQAHCLRLSGVLAYGNDLVRRRCGEQGVIRTILSSMEYHCDDESLLLHACTALTNFLHNSMENRHRFLEASGVDFLVGQMDRYRFSAKFQRQCCWAILTLAGSDEIARAVAFSGCSSAVVNAMINHRFDAGVQQYGCWAVSNLAIAGDDVKRRLKKTGVLEVCKIALETHPDNPEVVRQARNAMGVLGPAGTAAAAAAQSGGKAGKAASGQTHAATRALSHSHSQPG